MTTKRKREILVVAGDYDRAESAERGLPPAHFNVHIAFNHRDALYMYGQRKFDAMVIDAAMADRVSGELTMLAMKELAGDLPMIALGLDEASARRAYQLANSVVTSLDHVEIMRAVSNALSLKMQSTQEVRIAASGYNGASRKAEEINTLFDLSKSLTEVLDLSEVLNRVVEAARSLTDADEGMILLPEGEELYLRARTGIKVDAARTFRVKTRDTLAGEVFNLGEPRLIGASGPQKLKTQYFVNSLVYVPIKLQGETIGVLGVNNREREDLFDEHHLQLLENLASFAAVAIENARVHQESLERARELETLVAASQVVNASLALDETLPNICKQLATVLDVGYSEICNWDVDHNRLNTTARFYQAAWRFGQGPTIEMDLNPAVAASIKADRPMWMLATDNRHPKEASHLSGLGAGAMLIVPLQAGGKMLGAIRVYYVNSPDSPPSAESIYHIRRIALESLVDLLNRTDRIMSSSLLKLATEINNTVGADWCELSLWMEKRNRLIVLARIGNAVWLRPPYSYIDLTPFKDLTESLLSQSPILNTIEDEGITPGPRTLLNWSQSQSILGIPLVQRGKACGLVIFADTERQRQFTARELDMARAIVGQAAMALENASLVHDLEEKVAELKDAQKRLVQTARLSAMGELAAVVAHQINNPLTTIIVDTELLLMDEKPGSDNYNSLNAIMRTGKRAANVARRLLTIARPTETTTPNERIDVVDTVRGILSLLKTHVERSGILFDAILPDEPLPKVMAVKGRLDDIWLNLIMNAHDAIVHEKQKDGHISIEVKYTEGNRFIEVIVTDNGPGIPEEIRERIFSPFFTTKPVGEGTGLGLHVCREVVENIGGRIMVDSQPGEYTRFVVALPIAVAQNV